MLGYFTLGYQDTPLGPGDASVYSHWCTVPDASAETARLSGTPGFEFLENVWYHNGTFCE